MTFLPSSLPPSPLPPSPPQSAFNPQRGSQPGFLLPGGVAVPNLFLGPAAGMPTGAAAAAGALPGGMAPQMYLPPGMMGQVRRGGMDGTGTLHADDGGKGGCRCCSMPLPESIDLYLLLCGGKRKQRKAWEAQVMRCRCRDMRESWRGVKSAE